MSVESQENIQILHIDDEPDFTDLTATFLERENDRFAVETATSADEGLEIVADRPPDCIVSDYNMPGMDGIEFLETVRNEYSELPFILFTGKGSEDVASDALRAGATDYIRKQSGSEQYELLANRIQNAVEQHHSKRRAAALDRIRTLVADINQSLIRASSSDEVKAQVCRHISESTPYVTACFAEVDREAMQIEPQVWAGDAAGYFEKLDMDVDEDSPGRQAPGGRAFHEREIAISQNILEDERYAKWQDSAAERGFRSLAVVPIEYQDELHGLLAAFASRPNAFDQTEQRLLEELGDDIAHALHAQTLQTELKQAETLFQNAQDALFLINVGDDQFTIDRVNPGYERTTGLDSSELRGKTPRDLLGDEAGSEVEAKYQTCIDQHEPLKYNEELPIDSQLTYWETRIAPVTIDNEVEKLAGATRDITDQKEREQKLELVETLFEHAEECQFIVDVADGEFKLRHANEYYKRTVGLPADEPVTGQTPTGLFGETGGQEVLDRYRECVETRESVTYTVELPVPEEGTVYQTILAPVVTDGEVTHIVGTARDITELREREPRLQGERAFIEQSLDALDDVFYVFSTDREILRWNERLLEVTGYPNEEIPGMEPTDFFPKDHQPRIADAVTEIMETGDATVRADFLTTDDERVPHEFTGSQLTDSDGDVLGFVGIGRDLRRQREYERQLEQRNERLEEFTSIVSHDLRNPLRAADGWLELLRDECESDRIDDLAQALDRMDALIEDLLTLAREGKQVDETEQVGLANVATNSWQTVSTEQATLETNTSRAVNADRSRLQQLFENLYRNAVEHGSDDITVSVGAMDDGFYVADAGPGIPESDRGKVFEAGYSTAEEGTGFGLRIVEQVATAHDWEITVTENEQGGARFEVTGVEFADR